MNLSFVYKKTSKFIIICILITTIIKYNNVFAEEYNSANDKLVGNYILMDNEIYSIAHYNNAKSEIGFNTIIILNSYFPKSTMTVIPAPMSQIMIEDVKNLNNKLASQSEYAYKMKKQVEGTNIKIIDVCDTFKKHKDEYLYFKYDHHWQSLGAYYAYKDFCKENNLQCDDINVYRKKVLSKNYRGGAFKNVITEDQSIKGMSDVFTVYIASVSNAMKIYDNSGNAISSGAPCINENGNEYWRVFISGDNPYTEITANNGKKRTALVIKDSFGCAFVPYLVSNYDEIYVVDPRFSTFDIVEKMKDKIIDDIIVVCANYTFGQDVFIAGMLKILNIN